jgi:hypothetical protein
MNRLEVLALAFPYVALYTWFCSEVLAAMLIACKLRTIVWSATIMVVLGSIFLPAFGLV